MPNTDQVLMRAPDGKPWNIPRVNLDKAKARGFKEIEAPGAVDRLRTGLRETMGFSPEGGVSDDLSQIGSGLKREFTHPIDSLKLLFEGLGKSQQDVYDKGVSRFNQPGVGGKVEGAAQIAESGIPGLGPILSSSGEKFEKGDVAGGVGSMLPVLVGQASETPVGRAAAVKAADVATAPARATGEAVRNYLGGDPREIARARAEHTQKMQDINLENIQKQNTLEREYANKLQEAERAHQEAVNTAEGTTLQKQATYKMQVEQAKQDHAAKVAAQEQAYKEKVAAANAAHEKAVGGGHDVKNDVLQGGDSQSAARTGAQEKQDFQRGHGAAWQRVKGMTDKIAASIDPLAKKIRQTYDARWGAWREAMGSDTVGDFTPVMKAVEEAEHSLTGAPEDIKIFKDILKEGEDPLLGSATVFRGGGAGIDVKDLTGSRYMSEATRNRVLQSLRDAGIDEESGRTPIQETSLPIDDIRGYATDLQRKMLGGRYNPKIYKALKMVQQAAEGEVGRVAKSKGQFDQWQRLKGDWSQMLDDFNNSDGALYKLRNAVNTDARLNLLTGAEADRIIEALGRYSSFGPDINSVGRLRSLVHQINDLPSSAKSVGAVERTPRPSPVAEPKVPFPPAPEKTPEFKPPTKPDFTPKDTPPFDEQGFRRDKFLEKVRQFKSTGRSDAYAVGLAMSEMLAHMNPKVALATLSLPLVRRILGHVMDRPSVEAWVTKERNNIGSRGAQ